MRVRNFVAIAVAVALLLSLNLLAAKKKKKKDEEPVTQTLPVLQDPPPAITAATERLIFRVAPLSGKGLLSAQVRDSLKLLMQQNRGTIVKLRAFVAGTGDMRRVGTIVSEMFTDKHLPLPVVTTVQAGALPLDGAQVVIESTAVEKKEVNPHGLVFLQTMTVEQIKAALTSLGLQGGRVLRSTCFLPALDNYTETRAAVVDAFPAAAINLVQMQRVPVRMPVTCEAVAALERTPANEVEFRDGSRLALVKSPKLILTGSQLAFHAQDADVRLAFDRLRRTLESMNTSYKNVVVATIYPLAEDIAEKVRARQFDYFSRERPPVISSVLMEGLPSLDGSFAVDVVAVP